MRWFLVMLAVVFVVTVAVVLGGRVRAEGRAFVLGLTCGAAASVPASLLAVGLTRRGDTPRPVQRVESRQPYPPLVIMAGEAATRSQPLPDYPPLTQHEAVAPRGPRFRVVGDEGG